MSTKSDILDLLRRQPLTVAQLCERLGVTRNAVNVQLKQLEAEGLVRRGTQKERGVVGKPPSTFEAAPGSEDIASAAYRAVLLAVLSATKATSGPETLRDILEKAGRGLAASLDDTGPRDFDSRLRQAMAMVDALGASTEAVPQPGGTMVRNYSCPVGGALREAPCSLEAMAALFTAATGRPAREHSLRVVLAMCVAFLSTDLLAA